MIGYALKRAGDGRFLLLKVEDDIAYLVGMQEIPNPPPTPYELELERQRRVKALRQARPQLRLVK